MADASGRLSLDLPGDFTDGASPKAQAELAAFFEGEKVASAPVINEPTSDLVILPGGLVKRGEVIREVKVRELNGGHEELLAKARKTGDMGHFVNVLLECGTVRIGDEDPKKVPVLLKQLLIGDRNQILFGIRQATYGDEIPLPKWVCPACQRQSEITLSLSEDIENVTLDDPRTEATFEVQLRKGRKATVHLGTGSDELAMFEKQDLTDPERDSILLSRCITAMTEADGEELVTAGLGATIALGLSIPDRKAILRELVKRQPGPRYNEVKFTHQDCGEEVPLGLGLGDLFPDI